MSRLLRVLRALLALSLLIVAVGVGGLFLLFPRSRPVPELTIEATAERTARGRYLVEHVANCLDCHSDRDWRYYGGPVTPGTEGRGAPLRVLRPKIRSANITPAALGGWTDGEVVRAITAGIGREGEALHPFMPYDTYARMSEEDVHAVVAYLKTLPPIDDATPRQKDSLPIRLLGRLLPRPYDPPPSVDPGVTAEYGRYLANVAECSFCHGADFAGGRLFRIPDSDQTRVAANLTPHPSSRSAAWTRESFVAVFKSFTPPVEHEAPGLRIPDDGRNTVMPWSRYAGMSEDDLSAIYEYLRTLDPAGSASNE